jgi:ketosteroid isomerase-like protein
MTEVSNLDDFQALDPFFRIIEAGLAGLVDGEQFFDLLADDVVFEYVITIPGYPRRVEGRQAVAELYRQPGRCDPQRRPSGQGRDLSGSEPEAEVRAGHTDGAR